ncbi:hypothetical protein [Bacillus pseudomycoides]|uniref:hypothetical protein n=1 Tax=Bacillus pseudomycoides TaxID=64104 RepID=UPI003CF0540E
MSNKAFNPGDVFSLRLPNTLSDRDLEGINQLKETLGRDFNKTILPILLNAINEYITNKEKEITVPLPEKLNSEQEAQFNQPIVKQLIGQLVYQLILNPAQPINIATDSQTAPVETTVDTNKTDNFTSSFGAKFVANNLFDEDEDDD